MFTQLMKNKAFTLVEALVSLTLVGFLILTVTNLSVFVSEAYASSRIEESLHSVAISFIEDKRYLLQTSGTLPATREVIYDDIGDISYVLIGNTTALEYEGAFSINVVINTDTASISNEVILYA